MTPTTTDALPGDHPSDDRLASIAGGDEPNDDEACHLLACASCSVRVSGEPVPSPLADLPLLRAAPPAFDLGVAETRLLAAARRPEPLFTASRMASFGGLLAIAAAALVFVAVRQQSSPSPDLAIPVGHAAIEPTPGSRVAAVSQGADEVVVLEGEATFTVRKLPAGERFRVRAGRDEVEVRGTRFTVQASNETIARVRVVEGVVEVRAACCAPATLEAGQTWTPTPPTAPIAPSAPPEALTPPTDDAPPMTSAAPPTSAGAAPAGPSATELLAQGTSAYDTGRYAVAAGLLSRAVATEPKAAWARDTATLAGAARVLSTPPASIPSLGVSVGAFDTAAARARQRGDARVAAAASLGAARHLAGKAAESRFCALKDDGALSAEQRKEAAGRCPR